MDGELTMPILRRRRFTGVDQAAFARLSGDTNPIHMDAVAARRTLAGAPVVHGMHILLWGLDAFFAKVRRNPHTSVSLEQLSARFLRPLLVGDKLALTMDRLESSSVEISGHVGADRVLEIAARWSAGGRPAAAPSARLSPLRLRDLNLADAAGQSGSIVLGLDSRLARRMFPALAACLGPGIIAELAALSRLVGMRLPGRHSLLGGFTLRAEKSAVRGRMEFEVAETDPRFSRVEIAVRGPRLSGRLRAFFRPPPQPQPGIAEVARVVKRAEFSDSIALVVGGTRGLGETTAKLIAAGGGHPIITYRHGAADAGRIVKEIRAWGGRCDALSFDIRDGLKAIRDLYARADAPRSIYYFATSPIFGRRRGFFSHALLQDFMRYYVTSFSGLLDLVTASSTRKVRVFYPSSVALDEKPREMAEYAMAKRAGEDLCAFYNRFSSSVEILIARLPRVRTDQTATLLEIPAEDSLAVMLPIVRRIETT